MVMDVGLWSTSMLELVQERHEVAGIGRGGVTWCSNVGSRAVWEVFRSAGSTSSSWEAKRKSWRDRWNEFEGFFCAHKWFYQLKNGKVTSTMQSKKSEKKTGGKISSFFRTVFEIFAQLLQVCEVADALRYASVQIVGEQGPGNQQTTTLSAGTRSGTVFWAFSDGH